MLTVFRQSDATATVFFCCLFLCWYYLGVVSSTHSLPVLLLAVSYNTNGHWLSLQNFLETIQEPSKKLYLRQMYINWQLQQYS